VRFNNFATAPIQALATLITPDEVQVTPGGTFDVPTLMFTLNRTANTGELFESFFRFNATGPLLQEASIALNGATAAGDGAVTGILDVCSDGAFAGDPTTCGGTSLSTVVFKIESDSLIADSIKSSPASFFDVFVDLAIDGGLSGTASLQSSTVGIASVPEPSTILLLAGGLGVLGLRRLRRIF